MLEPTQPPIARIDIPDTTEPSGVRTLSYAQWGNPNARQTILCIHGLTRNGRDFDFLARALSNDYHVICPDMAGRGQSQWLSDYHGYTNTTYLGDIVFLLKSLAIENVIWIGTSMGGILGLMAANMQPGLIRALLLNDIGCFVAASGLQRIKDLSGLPASYNSAAEAEASFRKRTATFGIENDEQWQQLLTYGLEKTDTGDIRFTYDPDIFTAAFSQGAAITDVNLWPLWELVKQIPVLLIRGAISDILSHETALQMQSSHPAFRLEEIDGVGHAPALMSHKQITLIQQWISVIMCDQ